MPCKGICIRYGASNNYSNGQKRCNVCEQFIKWNGLYCPCCGHKLRTRPRDPKLNKKLREQKRALEEAKNKKNVFSFIQQQQ
jgi:hypothetical protein